MDGSIKNKNVIEFLSEKGGELKIIRSLLLFGKNSYTYKFALCEAFLQIGARQRIRQDEVFAPFINALIEHIKVNPKQFNNETGSKFMAQLKAYADGNGDFNQLLDEGARVIPNNVFERFQNIGGGTLANENLLYEFDKTRKEFNLRPSFLEILENERLVELVRNENQGRWRVVEEAWKIGVSPGLITFDERDDFLYVSTGDLRIPLRSAIDLLMPYQKGRCFYCNRKLSVFSNRSDPDFPDIDHFYPLRFLISILSPQSFEVLNPNGIWNLVVACAECNRGSKGKFDRVPSINYVQKLVTRNMYFAEEHKHAFRNSILLSMGVSKAEEIRETISKIDRQVISERWSTHLVEE